LVKVSLANPHFHTRPHNAPLTQNSLFSRPRAPFCVSTPRYTITLPSARAPFAWLLDFRRAIHARLLFPASRSHFRMSARPCLLAFPLTVPRTTAHCARLLAVSHTPARVSAACSLFPTCPRPLAVPCTTARCFLHTHARSHFCCTLAVPRMTAHCARPLAVSHMPTPARSRVPRDKNWL
jgi:hypothetical protein